MFPGPGGFFGGSRARRQQLRDFATKKPIAQWAGESEESERAQRARPAIASNSKEEP